MLSLRSPNGSIEVECVDDYEEVSPWLTVTTWVLRVREGKKESRVKLGELCPVSLGPFSDERRMYFRTEDAGWHLLDIDSMSVAPTPPPLDHDV